MNIDFRTWIWLIAGMIVFWALVVETVHLLVWMSGTYPVPFHIDGRV